MQFWLQDFRYALRMLRKNAVLTAVILASLAIGTGANSAIFSVVDALLLRPLPYPHSDRLAALWLRDMERAELISVIRVGPTSAVGLLALVCLLIVFLWVEAGLWRAIRTLGVRTDLSGLYAAAVQPGPGRLADRTGQIAAGASAR